MDAANVGVQALELTPGNHVETMRLGTRSILPGPVSRRVMYPAVDISGRRGSVTGRPVSSDKTTRLYVSKQTCNYRLVIASLGSLLACRSLF